MDITGYGVLPLRVSRTPDHSPPAIGIAFIVWTTNTKRVKARARAEVAVGRDGRYDRSAFAHGLPQITSTTRFFAPSPPPLRPSVRHHF
jgi:hypothetical protein